MNKKYAAKFPEWTRDNKKYYMCLSDDLDSLFSCILLEKILGYEITHFYSFNELFRGDNYINNGTTLAGIDMDIVAKDYFCWGNHVAGTYNPNSANINTILEIGNINYLHKYAGSCLLQIISYYDLDISMLSEEAKMILLAVDTTFKMYGFNKENCKHYLVDILELEDLYKLCEQHKQQEFYDLIKKYNLHEKIYINDDMLETSIDLKSLEKIFGISFILPKIKFKLVHTYNDVGVNSYQYFQLEEKLKSEGRIIFTKAWTNRNYLKLSYI